MAEKIACVMVPSPAHGYPGHPEAPERFSGFGRLKEAPFADRLDWLPFRPASVEEIQAAHTPELVEFLQEACRQGPAIIDGAPTYVTQASWQAALDAAGGALACARAVLRGEASAGLALVRPPGHHAERDRAMGFCLLNNLAIAVYAALSMGLERVLVVDFDVHHGNGTEDIFWREERVAFLSTHQWGIYPGTGSLEEAAHARGRIVNVPLPARAGDRAFAQILETVIRPLAASVRPQALFVSAGFDAHWSDPLASLGLSTGGFYRLSRGLVELAEEFCEGKQVCVLEGGYHPECLADGCLALAAALAGQEEPGDPTGPTPNPEPDVRPLLERVRAYHDLH
ncbi:MAG TPA: histone deacetylase [Anaerolineaceae bacterium]|nr:histone deacetylase [Anaerolineaceae bacterium]